MKFTAEIDVMPLDALLDPAGKAVSANMKNLALDTISNVRIGKHIRLFVEAKDEKEANEKVTEACSKLLANPVMESFQFTLTAQ